MNFEEWYRGFYGRDYDISEPSSLELKIGWDTCKQEVLKIIRDKNLPKDGRGTYIFQDFLEEEIKKL